MHDDREQFPPELYPDWDDEPDFERRHFLVGAALGMGALAGCMGKRDHHDRRPAPGATRPAPLTYPRTMEAARPAAAPRPEPPPRPAVVRKTGAEEGVVVHVTNSKAYDRRRRPAKPAVKQMVDRSLLELTGVSRVQDAWAKFFKPAERIALKPNCFATPSCEPSVAMIEVVLDGLKSIGVPERNIVVWDMWNFKRSPVYKMLRRRKIKVRTVQAWGYTRTKHKLPEGPATALCKPLAQVDAVLNIPVVKDHRLAGVTVALKNISYSSIPKPHVYHYNHCNPGIANVYNLPQVKNKVRLHLTDGMTMIYQGGPWYRGANSRRLDSIFATIDPVAMDRLAWELIDRTRKAKGMKPLMKRGQKSSGRGRPYHVLKAGELGLGQANYAKIKRIEKNLG